MGDRNPRRQLELQQDTPPPGKREWECMTPLQTPAVFAESKKKRKQKLDKNYAEVRDLLVRGQMVGLRALEKKTLNQLQLMREEMLSSVVDDLMEAIIEKVTPFLEDIVANAISGEGGEGNSPVVQAVLEKILPQITNIVQAELNSTPAEGAPVLNSGDQMGPIEEGARRGHAGKGFFKTMEEAEANEHEIFNMCDR